MSLGRNFKQKYLNFSKKRFPGQRGDEIVEFFIRQHWVVLVQPVFWCLIVLALLGTFDYFWVNELGARLPNWWSEVIVLNALIATIVFHSFFVALLNYFLDIHIVTDVRIIDMHITTVFCRNQDSVDLSRIQDMRVFQRGIMHRILDYGDVILHNSTGQEIFRFSNIPCPHKYFNAISHIYHRATLNLLGRDENTALKEALLTH